MNSLLHKIWFPVLISFLFFLGSFSIYHELAESQGQVLSIQDPVKTTLKITPYVSTYGTKLYLNGLPYRFTGVNAYNIGSLDNSNAGCGGQTADIDAFFSQLKPNMVVRMWAFQGSITTNAKTKQTDWTGLDRAVAAAQKSGVKLILVLGDQSGTCDDGHWKDLAWYTDGFKKPSSEGKSGLTPLAYLDYVKLVVNRYKDSTTIAMWEPINEPEAANCEGFKGSVCYTKQKCPNESAAAKGLRSFFDTVGGEIKKIDQNHIVSSGVIGDGQCGAVFEDYSLIHQSSGVDVASYHDYKRDDSPMPGDQWNGLQKRIDQMKSINKPLMIGEVGMLAMDKSSQCMNYESRRDKFKAKMDAQFKAGIAGYLVWDLTGGTSSICNYDVVKNDPTIELLRNYPIPSSIAK